VSELSLLAVRWWRFRRSTITIVLVACLWIAGGLACEAVEADWVEPWRSDLRALAEALHDVHPDPYIRVPRAEIEADLERLSQSVPNLEHHEIVVELARIVARIGDGHTRVTLPLEEDSGFFLGHSETPLPNPEGLVFRPLPIRLSVLGDGVFVSRIESSEKSALGARVKTIGGHPIDAVIEAVSPVVHRDNEMQFRFQLPDFLVLPEVLHARGVLPELGAVEIGVVAPEGEESTLELEPMADGTSPDWVSIADRIQPRPLYLRNRERNFWFAELEDERTIYWQYNEVSDGDEETLAEFEDRFFDRIDAGEAERLIIDLRWNRGGNNGLNRPLLHRILRTDRINRPGGLFVITGGGTFSAAMMFATDLEKHTHALFVGEPTGSSPNHFGDSRKTRLEASGLTVRISTLYWQYSDPRDERAAIEPDLAAPLRSVEFRAGTDPSLDAILVGHAAPPHREGLFGLWRGWTTISPFRYEIVLDIQSRLRGPDRSEPEVKLSLPGFGVEDHRVESLRIEGPSLAFEERFGESLLMLRARLEGGRLYGELGEGSRTFPFVLEFSDH